MENEAKPEDLQRRIQRKILEAKSTEGKLNSLYSAAQDIDRINPDYMKIYFQKKFHPEKYTYERTERNPGTSGR